jgi:hypothetical protein
LRIGVTAVSLHAIGQRIDLDFFACGNSVLNDSRSFREGLGHLPAAAATAEMRNLGRSIEETRVTVGGIQSHPHVNARATVSQRFADPSSTFLELGHLGEDAGVHGEIRLHESDSGAWAEPLPARRNSRGAKSAGQESAQDRTLPHQALTFAVAGAMA